MRLIRLVVLLLAGLPAVAASQSAGAARSVAIAVDNDLFAVRGTGAPPDYDYTHGMRVAVAWAGAPGFARRLLGRASSCQTLEARRIGCVAAVIAAGQEIYTPRRDAVAPVPGERPYAGWLYTSFAARVVAPGRARSFGAEVGVSGPPSLAEPVQNGVHRLLRNDVQLGWAHQLPAAVGFTVRYGEVRRADRTLGRSTAAGVALRWGAAAGTVVTALTAGADATFGLRGALPWTPAEPEIERPSPLYVLAGYRQDAVLRNILVEGGRGGSGRAERRLLVGQAEAGVGYRRRGFALEYRHVVRGREYVAQPASHAYGSLALTMHGF